MWNTAQARLCRAQLRLVYVEHRTGSSMWNTASARPHGTSGSPVSALHSRILGCPTGCDVRERDDRRDREEPPRTADIRGCAARLRILMICGCQAAPVRQGSRGGESFVHHGPDLWHPDTLTDILRTACAAGSTPAEAGRACRLPPAHSRRQFCRSRFPWAFLGAVQTVFSGRELSWAVRQRS